MFDYVFDTFTIFKVLYYLVTLLSMIKYFELITRSKNILLSKYPIWPGLVSLNGDGKHPRYD